MKIHFIKSYQNHKTGIIHYLECGKYKFTNTLITDFKENVTCKSCLTKLTKI